MKVPKLISLLMLLFAPATGVWAGSTSWIGGTSPISWATNANWASGTAPGTATVTGNADIATFNTSTGVGIGMATRGLNTINFDGAVGSFTFNNGNFYIQSGGGINLLATATSTGQTETFNSPVTAIGSFGINNSSASDVFSFTGAMTSSSTSARTWNIRGTNTGANTISGAISNNGTTSTVAITKMDAGKWILSGANTYSGGTVISGGTLLANSATALGTGAVIVGNINGSGTLGGTGTVTGATTVASGSTLLAGDGTTGTTLTVNGGLTMSAGSILQFTLGTGAQSVLSLSGGAVTFNNTTVDFLNITAGTYNGLVTGLTADPLGEQNWVLDNAGYSAVFSYSGGNINAVVTSLAVPEPATWALILGGFAGLLAFQRRRFTMG